MEATTDKDESGPLCAMQRAEKGQGGGQASQFPWIVRLQAFNSASASSSGNQRRSTCLLLNVLTGAPGPGNGRLGWDSAVGSFYS